MIKPPLRSFRVENFKAVRDSKRISFDWLTVLIGNNGVGKSSLIEGLETFRNIVVQGLDPAMSRWRGFEHIWNKSHERELQVRVDHRACFSHPLRFWFDWKLLGKQLKGRQSITQGEGGNSLFIQQEQLIQRRKRQTERWTRNDNGDVFFQGGRSTQGQRDERRMPQLDDGDSMLKHFAWESFDRWQFLMLNPERMGHPTRACSFSCVTPVNARHLPVSAGIRSSYRMAKWLRACFQ